MPPSSADGGTSRQLRTANELRVPCHMFLPMVTGARVIGKGGVSIRAIREQSGASVQVLQKELPAAMRRREDNIVIINGTSWSTQKAISGILERVFDRSGLPSRVDSSKDRLHTVEILVPEKCSSRLIGQRGEQIKALMEETQCDLNLIKEPMPGLQEQKRLRITGDAPEFVGCAVWRLCNFLSELVADGVLKLDHFELRVGRDTVAGGGVVSSAANEANEVKIRLLCSKEEGAWIVGRRGNKITKLRDIARVQMNDAESPPFDDSERVVEIASAPLEDRIRVVEMIVNDLALRPEPTNELRLLVPTDVFGSLMGHRGETIRRIIQSTKADLRQHKANRSEDGGEYWLRVVEIQGTKHQCIEAVQQVHQAIEKRGRTAETSDVSMNVLTSTHEARNPSRDVERRVWTPGESTSARDRVEQFSTVTASQHRTAENLRHREVVADLSGQVVLQLAMPSEEVAKQLANDTSGIAWRAGVHLSVARGAGGMPILQVTGSAVGNSVACYLIQDQIFMMH